MTNFGVKSAIWFGSVDANDNLYVQLCFFLQIKVFLLSLTRVTASGPHRTQNSTIMLSLRKKTMLSTNLAELVSQVTSVSN